MAAAGCVLAVCASVAVAARPGSRNNPYAFGAAGVMPDRFAIRIVSVNRQAWPVLEAANASNRPPGPGRTYVLVTMRATNRGKRANIPFDDGITAAVSRSGASYNTLANRCGRVPTDVANIDVVPPQHTVTARTCWAVPTAEAASLVMFYKTYDGAPGPYFALRPHARLKAPKPADAERADDAE
jgi:hypothetical protein